MADIDQLPLNTFVVVPADGTRKFGVVVGRKVKGEVEGSFPVSGQDRGPDMVQVLIPTSMTVLYQTTGYCCFPGSVDLATPDDVQAISDKSWMRRLDGSLAIRLQEQNGLVTIRLMSSGDTMIVSKLDWMSLPIAS